MPQIRTNSLRASAGEDLFGSLATPPAVLNSIPPPRISPPVMTMAGLGLAESDPFEFHAVGDTGGTNERMEEAISGAMAADVGNGAPKFMLHLGDVMYGANKDQNYLDRFYRAFASYPNPIIAIPGNHDGEIRPSTDPTTLRAFWANFCAAQAQVPADVAQTGITRETETQPGVYWWLQADNFDLIGLYSNTAENGGSLEGDHQDQSQIEFLKSTLAEVLTSRTSGGKKALIIATHHPAYSSSGHSGSAFMLQQIDDCCTAVGIYPSLFLAGHAHNYQRYTRRFLFNGEAIAVPFLVAGTGGYGLQAVALPTGTTTGQVTYDQATKSYGYLTVRIEQGQITTTMRTVDEDGSAVDFDQATFPI